MERAYLISQNDFDQVKRMAQKGLWSAQVVAEKLNMAYPAAVCLVRDWRKE